MDSTTFINLIQFVLDVKKFLHECLECAENVQTPPTREEGGGGIKTSKYFIPGGEGSDGTIAEIRR